jgi:hypothetical protein
MALPACANQSGMVPSSPSAMAPTAAHSPDTTQNDTRADDTAMSPLTLKSCATRPPQHQWIFKGACQTFDVMSTGAHFRLGEYHGITVKGFIGRNTAKERVKFALADAIDKNGDIKTYKGETFPRYKGRGTTYFYASAVNQSTQVIKMVTVRGQPVLQYVVTNANGFGDANICSAAVLTFRAGKPAWKVFPVSSKVNGKTVTITKYTVVAGFELPPKIPVYFATNCYKQ